MEALAHQKPSTIPQQIEGAPNPNDEKNELTVQTGNSDQSSARTSGPAFVFDSAPGQPSFRIMARAVTANIASPFLRALAYVPSGLTVLIFKFLALRSFIRLHLPFGRAHVRDSERGREPFAQMWADLINPSLIPPSAPRLYFYSTPDLLVPSEDVEEHIAQARKAGVTSITTLKSDRAAHVSHMRLDPVNYWASVRKLWMRE